MRYVCDASADLTWFALENEAEAERESADMNHAVEKHYRAARADAAGRFAPPAGVRYIEQDIGKADFIARTMPMFLTLRDGGGAALVTAMLPPRGAGAPSMRAVVVGRGNADPYPAHGAEIAKLGAHFGISLDGCFPYRRG